MRMTAYEKIFKNELGGPGILRIAVRYIYTGEVNLSEKYSWAFGCIR